MNHKTYLRLGTCGSGLTLKKLVKKKLKRVVEFHENFEIRFTVLQHN